MAQDDVHHARAVAHQRLDRLVVLEALAQAGAAVGECLAEGRDAILAGGQGRGQRVQERPVRQRRARGGRFHLVGGRGGHGLASQRGGRSPAPSVSTSNPLPVTSTVCSHCDDSE